MVSQALCRGAAPLVSHLGYRVWSEDDLKKLANRFAAQGCPVRWMEQAEPGHGRTA